MKKAVLVTVFIVLIFTAGLFYWFYQVLNKNDENETLSKQIPKSIFELFDHKSVEQYPFTPQEIKWDKKFLLLDEYADLRYNKARNEELGTHTLFPNANLNGLILVRNGVKSYGKYITDDNQQTGQEAFQSYFVVNYFDLKQKVILAKDTIWGEKPKVNKRSSEDQHGLLSGNPSENELIETIRKRLY